MMDDAPYENILYPSSYYEASDLSGMTHEQIVTDLSQLVLLKEVFSPVPAAERTSDPREEPNATSSASSSSAIVSVHKFLGIDILSLLYVIRRQILFLDIHLLDVAYHKR